MEENKREIMNKSDIGALSHEITYRRYLMNKGKVKDLFQHVSLSDYIVLYSIAKKEKQSSGHGEKTYLKDISAKMELSTRQTSRIISGLRDRGLLVWSHDGNGSEGTYVTITQAGEQMLKAQESVLKRFYGEVIDRFGREKLIHLLQLMQELETTMSFVYDEMEEKNAADDN